MCSSKVGRGESGLLSSRFSSSYADTSSSRACVCEAEEECESCVPSVPNPCGISDWTFTPQSSARWKAVPMCTSLCPFFSALLNSLSAARGSYFGEKLHKVRKSWRPASLQSVAMANASCMYS